MDLQPRIGVKDDMLSKKTIGGRNSRPNGKEKSFRPKKKKSDFRSGNKDRRLDVRKSGCFLYNGPHRARDCPTKAKIGALVAAVDIGQEEEVPPA